MPGFCSWKGYIVSGKGNIAEMSEVGKNTNEILLSLMMMMYIVSIPSDNRLTLIEREEDSADLEV